MDHSGGDFSQCHVLGDGRQRRSLTNGSCGYNVRSLPTLYLPDAGINASTIHQVWIHDARKRLRIIDTGGYMVTNKVASVVG